MKRFIITLLTLCLCFSAVYADEQGDEYYDDEYKTNDSGDQFLKMTAGAFFPLNFGNTLETGINATIGYYRFINSWFAIGGEITPTSNVSIGKKMLVTLPITFGAIAQPVIGKFEFPVSIGAGVAITTWQNQTYFPALAVKASAGAFFRLTEAWSFGLNSCFTWIPQWYEDPSKNTDGLFISADLAARFHF